MQQISEKLYNSYQRPFKLLCFAIIALSSSLEVLIVNSDFSKSVIPSLASDIKSRISDTLSIEISYCDYSSLEKEISIHPNLLAIFDITGRLGSQFKISKLCEDNFLIHFIVSDSLPYQNKKTFSLSSSKNSWNKAITATLSFFNWTSGVAVANIEKYSYSHLLLSNYYSEKIKLFSVSSETFIENFIKRELMILGSSMFYLFTDQKRSLDIQQALISAKLLTNGTGILLIGESSYDSKVEGALSIIEKGKENVDSYAKYLSVAISETILLLKNASNIDDALFFLSKKCLNHYCINEFSLINIQESQRKVVGSIKNGDLVLNSSIMFPGGSFDVPTSQKKIIYISANDGTTNPGAAPSQAAIFYKRGLTLALKEINNGIDMLQNFQIKLNDFDCGANVYNPTFCYNCFNKDKDRLGLAHIVGSSSAMAYGEIATLEKLNITLPCVGAINFDPGLSNSTKYPLYSRVSLPSRVAFTHIPLMLKVMGWNSVAFLYQNESTGNWANLYFTQAAIKQNLKIVNEIRVIPQLLTREQIRNYAHIFQDIIDSNVRMIVLVLSSPLVDYAAELFYDLGMRRGDIMFFSVFPSWISTVANKDDYTYKRVEIAIPMITAFQALFVGEKGKKVRDELYETYGNTEPNSYSCLYYDAGYLIGKALDWSINQGNDYTDPYILQNSIRDVRFTGCSGNVYMQKGSNDVLLSSFKIQSNSYNITSGILKIFSIGFLSPTSLNVLTIVNPIVYADGTNDKPTDFRVTRTNCPFDDKLKRLFNKGRALVFGICFFIAVLTAISTFLIWKKWWDIEVKELTKREEISVVDAIVGISIMVEFFQLIFMGPDIRTLSPFLADICNMLTLDLKSFAKLENGVFWWFATGIIVLCWLWTIFCFEIFFHWDEKFRHIWFFRALGVLADHSMPVLGNLCFIPFISILLEVFICDHSIGNNFTDSYLSIDCYQFCWKGNHMIYAILSAISLICYEPFAIFCRPLWQEFQSALHVKSYPLYLMVKTVVQVVLIVLNKTLKRSSGVTHGFVFTFFIGLYAVFFLKFRAYNYGRYNLWLQLSLIGIAWISCLATINMLIKRHSFPWISLILGGWCILIFIGFIIQKKKYPNLLYRKKGKDTSTLFKFAFTFWKQSRMHRSKIELQKP
ncbi:unnamed protein product [Blepharisma stoltei]|uniref:Receptor ligand binding region domain-containing protein n=1 Tax=Blepharisma stoltei TaxID=1481888 RepID=A0AAU9JVZ3_9CILI|nr:unnamed protein product [Blepharisma stoltei]